MKHYIDLSCSTLISVLLTVSALSGASALAMQGREEAEGSAAPTRPLSPEPPRAEGAEEAPQIPEFIRPVFPISMGPQNRFESKVLGSHFPAGDLQSKAYISTLLTPCFNKQIERYRDMLSALRAQDEALKKAIQTCEYELSPVTERREARIGELLALGDVLQAAKLLSSYEADSQHLTVLQEQQAYIQARIERVHAQEQALLAWRHQPRDTSDVVFPSPMLQTIVAHLPKDGSLTLKGIIEAFQKGLEARIEAPMASPKSQALIPLRDALTPLAALTDRATEHRARVQHTYAPIVSDFLTQMREKREESAQKMGIWKAAWDLKTLTPQEIAAVFSASFDAVMAADGENKGDEASFLDFTTSLLRAVLAQHKHRREQAERLFLSLHPPIYIQFKVSHYRLPRDVPSHEDGFGNGEPENSGQSDYGSSEPYASPYFLELCRRYGDYVERTFEWLPPEAQRHYQKERQTIGEMVRDWIAKKQGQQENPQDL